MDRTTRLAVADALLSSVAALTAWVESARAHRRGAGADPRRLHALVETPFFVDSCSTRLMQLADLVSYALYRAYNVGDWASAGHLLPSIRAGRGSVLHVPERAGCVCVVCDRPSETPCT